MEEPSSQSGGVKTAHAGPRRAVVVTPRALIPSPEFLHEEGAIRREVKSAVLTVRGCFLSQVQGVWGNPAATSVARLSCLLHVRSPAGDAVMVYLKRGTRCESLL